MIFRLRIITAVLSFVVVLTLVGVIAASAAVILGDADGDGKVTITDATFVQQKLAGLPLSGDFSAGAADVDGNGEIESLDVTYIQRWIVRMDTPYTIGVLPTEAPTQAPTQAPTSMPTDSDGWGREIFQP